MRRCGTLWADGRGRWLASVAAALALSGASLEAQAPPRATQISYDRDTQKNIINDLSDGFMDGFSSRSNRVLPGTSLSQPTSQMRAVRPLLRDFSNEAAQLASLLADELRRIPSIRSQYTAALNVSAMAVTLEKNAQRFNDHTLLQDDFRQLDASWRELAYRLEGVRGLRRETTDSMTAINDIDEQIRDAIGIRPQVNRRELWQKCNELANDFKNLMDDIRLELPGNDGRQFLVQLSRARQQIMTLASAFEDQTADIEFISEQYKQFQAVWYPQRAKLQEYDNRMFERSLRRITQTDGEIHQLLLLPTKIDNQQLIYLTSALSKDIDEFFDRMSLKLLMHLPKADRVAGVASEFYGVCENFVDEVQHDADYDQLVDAFRYIESAERSFRNVFNDLESDEAQAALQQISQTIFALRTAIAVQDDDGFDHQRAIELAGSLESYTEQLEYYTRRWLNRERPPFASTCLNNITQMRNGLEQLHTDLLDGGSPSQYRRNVEAVYSQWKRVYADIIKCQTEDRANLGRLAARITPALVELRTTLTQ